MALVEFGKASTHKLWKYVLTDWEGDTYKCPKCGFETITNEGTEPAFNFCPMCGKKMGIDEENEVTRKEKKKTYIREYQQKKTKRYEGRYRMSILSNFNETTSICNTCIHSGECKGTVCYGYESEQWDDIRMNNDLISRQDAIDALEEQLDYLQKLDKNDNPTAESKWYGVNWARNTIADLPSAQNKGGAV